MAKLKSKQLLKKKKTLEIVPVEEDVVLPSTRQSDEPAPKKPEWINRQRVLVFATRGINHRHRHLMEDIKRLMPHHKPESKMERNKNLFVVNELCEMKNCNKALMFEGRKKKDLYLWMTCVPNGPSAKFLVENTYTMGELKFTGNCLRGTRPLLSFDESFTSEPHLQLLKEILQQIFGVPKHHPKSQPFIDHVYTFTLLDNRIWFRNYQILSEDGGLAEIGPRFVLNPVKLFSGSFGGATLWENQSYITPSKYRRALLQKSSIKYENRIIQKTASEMSKPKTAYTDIQSLDIFSGSPMKVAEQEIKAEKIKEETAEEDKNKKEIKLKTTKKTKTPNEIGKFAIKRKHLKNKPKKMSKAKQKVIKKQVKRK